jgi:hypothetical protein
MNSRLRILESSPWIKEAYRGEGCKGTGARAAAGIAALHESESGPNRPPGLLLAMSASWGEADAANALMRVAVEADRSSGGLFDQLIGAQQERLQDRQVDGLGGF